MNMKVKQCSYAPELLEVYLEDKKVNLTVNQIERIKDKVRKGFTEKGNIKQIIKQNLFARAEKYCKFAIVEVDIPKPFDYCNKTYTGKISSYAELKSFVEIVKQRHDIEGTIISIKSIRSAYVAS